jgi:hypothetical protein
MTSWKDTPDMKGFLPTAIADTQVAIEEVVEMRSPRYARSVKPGWQIRNTVRFRVPRR